MSEVCQVIYVTKFAISSGIVIAEAVAAPDGEFVLARHPTWSRPMGLRYPEWHRTLSDAKDHARSMRDRRLAALEIQVSKLKAMEF